jgi:hypothetical protein
VAVHAHERRQCCEHGPGLVRLEPDLLLFHPGLRIVGGARLGRLAEVFAEVEEIHQEGPPRAEAGVHLGGDPGRAVAHRVEVAGGAEPRLGRATLPLPPAFLRPPGEVPAEHRRRAALGMHQAQPDLLPAQGFALALVAGLARGLHHRRHGPVDFPDEEALRRPRRHLARGLLPWMIPAWRSVIRWIVLTGIAIP